MGAENDNEQYKRYSDARKYTELDIVLKEIENVFRQMGILREQDTKRILEATRILADGSKEQTAWASEALQKLTESAQVQQQSIELLTDLQKRVIIWIEGREDQEGSARKMLDSKIKDLSGRLKLIYWGFGISIMSFVALAGYFLSKYGM